MTNVSSLVGLTSSIIFFISSCVHFRRINALKSIILSAKDSGPFSLFYKASVFGVRLQLEISVCSFILALFILFK